MHILSAVLKLYFPKQLGWSLLRGEGAITVMKAACSSAGSRVLRRPPRPKFAFDKRY